MLPTKNELIWFGEELERKLNCFRLRLSGREFLIADQDATIPRSRDPGTAAKAFNLSVL